MMLIVWLLIGALLGMVIVMVEVPEPGAAMGLGLKATVRLPSPLSDNVIAELKPSETAVVIVDVPDAPRARVSEVGDALRVKVGFVLVTVRLTVVVSTVLPEVPVTLME